jgi:hypothetical protein
VGRPIASLQPLIDIVVQLFPERFIHLVHMPVADLFVRNGDLLAEPGEFPLVILEHPQCIANHFAHRAVAARGYLLVDEALEVIS